MSELFEPRPSIRQAHKDLTRSRIADAARTCFYEKGVMETSFEEIAVAAGVRRATVYLHFANKNAILAELLSQNLTEVRRLYERLLTLPRRDAPAVRRWIVKYVQAIVSHRQALRLFQVAVAADETVRLLIETYRDDVMRSLGTIFPAFAATSSRARAVALLMIVDIDFIVDAAVQTPPRIDVEPTLDLLAERLSVLLNMTGDDIRAL